MKRIFRNISLIMCTITLTFVGCENKLETVNNDSNNNETESEVISGSINGHDYIGSITIPTLKYEKLKS